MVNARVVNGRGRWLNRADFGEFLLVLGCFLHLKNPFKYNQIFEINQRIVRALLASTRRYAIYCAISTRWGLTLTQDICAKLHQDREAAFRRLQRGRRRRQESKCDVT
jgi:hypothetical protein